jgi:predicted nucleotidyltransferase
MDHGLNTATVEKLHSVFEKFPQIRKAILYGSRAKGSYKPGSDIDLCLVGSELSAKLCVDIEEQLDDLLLPYTIDLSVFDLLNHAELKAHIERVGIELYVSTLGFHKN